MTTLGILGGGQLARMLALAAAPLGVRVRALDPAAEACAAPYATLTQAPFDDTVALGRFAAQADAVTFDFENVPAHGVAALQEVPVHPGPAVLATAQDRLREKTLFRDLGIPVPAFRDITSRDDLHAAVLELGLPCILKTRRFGYDGKGQFRLRAEGAPASVSPEAVAGHAVDAAWAALGGESLRSGLILEAHVPFTRELSVIAVRGRDGEFHTWPLTQNWHVDGVLSVSVAPAQVGSAIATQANGHARRLAEALDYVGVFALELFECDGELLANEMAPRVHNSGHWTIEGAETSQFENHVRAVLGLPLGSTAMRGIAAMLNFIGEMPQRDAALTVPGLHWHDYGKQARAGRKVGHATLRANDTKGLMNLLQRTAVALGREAQVAPVIEALRGV